MDSMSNWFQEHIHGWVTIVTSNLSRLVKVESPEADFVTVSFHTKEGLTFRNIPYTAIHEFWAKPREDD